jgi:hypothetical protein
MSIASSYLLYLAVFRLSIIITGALSIFLGYRLFLKGVGPSEAAKTGAQLEAAASSYRLTLRNAAPGTFFALFGAIIIGANFYQGGPSLTLKTLAEAVKLEGEAPAENGFAEFTMKGMGSFSTIKALTEAGKRHERRGDALKAKAAYREALNVMAEPMNNLARMHGGLPDFCDHRASRSRRSMTKRPRAVT